VAMEQGSGPARVPVFGVYPDGTELVDGYTGEAAVVRDGAVALEHAAGLVLLSERR
jgi:hypothetical protein